MPASSKPVVFHTPPVTGLVAGTCMSCLALATVSWLLYVCLEPMCFGALPVLHVTLLLPSVSAVVGGLSETVVLGVCATLTAQLTRGTFMVAVDRDGVW